MPFEAQEAALTPTKAAHVPCDDASSRLKRLDLIQGAFAAGANETRSPDDVMGAKTCSEPQTSGALVATPTPVVEKPSAEALAEIARDAADQSCTNMEGAVEQRLLAFIAASGYLAESAKDIDDDKSAILSFIATAFEVVSGALCGVGLAKMVATGLTGFFKNALDKTFGATASAAMGAAKRSGDKVQLGDFTLQQALMLADAHRAVGDAWRAKDARERLLESPHPDRASSDLLAATDAIRLDAFRRQYVHTMTAWIASVREVKGGDVGTLVVHVDFDARGGYAVESCVLEGMGEGMNRALTADILASDRNVDKHALTLGEILAASMAGNGLRVRVVDDSRAPFEWDARAKAITTDDAHLMHHHVAGWGAKKLSRDLIPMVSAHRFLFEELGAKTLGELGLH